MNFLLAIPCLPSTETVGGRADSSHPVLLAVGPELARNQNDGERTDFRVKWNSLFLAS